MSKKSLLDELPGRGQRVILQQLVDPHDPITEDRVMTFMFVDPDHRNLLWFLDNGRMVAIPRNPDEVYTDIGTLTLEGLPTMFGFGLGNACISWRPYRGFA